jgi:2-keto-4-pentenoate hydratase/2-oxohepta-3-ene-1,7-dioic acid hydratase in catechol pathway
VKLVTFQTKNGEERIGALLDDLTTIADFRAAAGTNGRQSPAHFSDMLALIDGGDTALAEARRIAGDVYTGRAKTAAVKLSNVKLLAPVPVPRQMRDFLAFELHYKQARAQALRIRAATFPDPAAAAIELAKTDEFKIPPIWYDQPVYYKGNRFSVVGPEADVLWPSYCQKLDFELEFGAIVGRRGKNISRESAGDHIFGYCIFNDMSARDAQYREYPGRLGPAKGKDFDTGNILGPWLVTADEVGDPYNLTMVARVNGEEWGRGSSGSMYHKFEDMIAHASKDETLHPGEFLGSGTVGNGCGLEHDRWLQPGDVIELEVEKLGTLRNRVVKPASS